MPNRKSLKIRHATAKRFDHYQRPGESHTDALGRLLDEAGVPETITCYECGEELTGYIKGEDGHVYCANHGVHHIDLDDSAIEQ